MKKVILIFFAFLAIISCKKNDIDGGLNGNKSLKFSGTFKSINSSVLTGTVTLEFANGYYKSTTNLPYGKGAGKLQTNGNTITFADTLFFPVPAIWGPSYILSGKHNYKFDGENLTIWKDKNVGSVEYTLKVVK